MIVSNGKNDFANHTFDKYRWSANTYETPEEIFEYFDSLNIGGKKVKNISAIGALSYYALGDRTERAIEMLMDAGMIADYDPFEDRISFADGAEKTVAECRTLLDNVTIERRVILYEPMIITFEDDTTLELLPCASKGLRIGYCTIPHGITDGVNHCEFDIGVLFNECVSGRDFYLFDVISTGRHITYHGPRKDRYITYNIYVFGFRKGELRIEENQGNEYEVLFTHSERIKCGALADVKPHPLNDSVILEASHRGGAVNIYPVIDTGEDEMPSAAQCHETISVCYFLPQLVVPLMSSYFEPDLPMNRKHSQGHYDEYYWNFYTKASILRMMDEVEQQISLVRTLPFYQQCDKLCLRTTDGSDGMLKKKVEAELDYTRRFCIRLKEMALNTPGYDYISFEGP